MCLVICAAVIPRTTMAELVTKEKVTQDQRLRRVLAAAVSVHVGEMIRPDLYWQHASMAHTKGLVVRESIHARLRMRLHPRAHTCMRIHAPTLHACAHSFPFRRTKMATGSTRRHQSTAWRRFS